jgi:hypothetical protein
MSFVLVAEGDTAGTEYGAATITTSFDFAASALRDTPAVAGFSFTSDLEGQPTAIIAGEATPSMSFGMVADGQLSGLVYGEAAMLMAFGVSVASQLHSRPYASPAMTFGVTANGTLEEGPGDEIDEAIAPIAFIMESTAVICQIDEVACER